MRRMITDTITVYSNKKIKFRDDNIYISSKADGHLDLDADTSVDVNSDFTYTGHKDSQVLTANAFNVVDSDWTQQSDGSILLDQNKSAKKLVIPISGLKVGDEIAGFRIVGSIGAKAGGTSTLDADLRKITKASGSITDASVGSMTQIAAVADAAVDNGSTLGSAETVAADYQYYILVTGTTDDNVENDIFIAGAEVDVNRK